MYHPFIQFTIPKIGQALVAVLLYANFLQLPFLLPFAESLPLLYLLLPLVLLWGLSYLSRDPLGPGMIFVAHLTALYVLCSGVNLAAHFVGGRFGQVWDALYLGGVLPWVLTCGYIGWGRRRARRLCVTHYQLSTTKPLPGGKLRIVQISDIHPGATMNHARIPELEEKINALQPDLIVLTGDIYDETCPREEFEAFNALFARLQAPLGKYFVYGNHDVGEHFRKAAFTRQDLEDAFAAGNVRILQDEVVEVGGLRIVGRKDYLFVQQQRLSPAALLPAGPDGIYTVWLDHEPRELRDSAAAGADLMLCGHTHGGQIWPLGLVAWLFRYNEVNYGLKRYGNAAAIVSGGTGTWGYQIRTEGKTEIVCIDLTQD